jgi:hypothetical protein
MKTNHNSLLYEMENGEEDILVNDMVTEVQTDEKIKEDIQF